MRQALPKLACCFLLPDHGSTYQVCVDSRLDVQRPARPCKQSPSLGDHPVHGAIDVNNGEGGIGRSNGNESCDRGW